MRREFDVVAAWSVERPGRSLQDLVVFLNDLHKKGIDTTIQEAGSSFRYAEFERSMIVKCVKAGLKRARAEGKVTWAVRVSARL